MWFTQAAVDASMNPLLSDVCISSASAPTYFPANYFKTQDPQGNHKEFHLIDGGIAANNPVRILINLKLIVYLPNKHYQLSIWYLIFIYALFTYLYSFGVGTFSDETYRDGIQ